MTNPVITHKTLTWEQFKKLPNHPLWDKSRYFSRAKRAPHLHGETGIKQHHVETVIVGDTEYKLEGHSRCMAWDEGNLSLPLNDLNVTTYTVDDMETANMLFKHTDSKSSVDSSSDLYNYAKKSIGLDEFKSPIMQKSQTSAIRSAAIHYEVKEQGVQDPKDIYEAMARIEPAILMFDDMNLSKQVGDKNNKRLLSSGMIAGILTFFTVVVKDDSKDQTDKKYHEIVNAMLFGDSSRCVKFRRKLFAEYEQCYVGGKGVNNLRNKVFDFLCDLEEDA